MKIWILILTSTLLSAQDRTTKQFRQPNGRLMGTVECDSKECKAYDVHRHLLGTYNKMTKESRYPNGRIIGKFDATPALVYSRCPTESRLK